MIICKIELRKLIFYNSQKQRFKVFEVFKFLKFFTKKKSSPMKKIIICTIELYICSFIFDRRAHKQNKDN